MKDTRFADELTSQWRIQNVGGENKMPAKSRFAKILDRVGLFWNEGRRIIPRVMIGMTIIKVKFDHITIYRIPHSLGYSIQYVNRHSL